MGRQFVYRHRLKSEAASVKAKTLFDYLVSLVKARREVSFDEALLIAGDAWQYVSHHLGMKQLGALEFPAVVAEEDTYFRRARSKQNEKLVSLSVLEDDDVDLFAEFGVRAMVTGRMARVIEEAYCQRALLDFNRLCLLFPLNVFDKLLILRYYQMRMSAITRVMGHGSRQLRNNGELDQLASIIIIKRFKGTIGDYCFEKER